ncbi:MAG: CoA synthetase, partial [Alphaproteobacteria bacterium]
MTGQSALEAAPCDIAGELVMICAIADMLEGLRHVAIGAASPIPGSAAFLAQHRAGGAMRVSLLGQSRKAAFSDGARELFDCAAQGR